MPPKLESLAFGSRAFYMDEDGNKFNIGTHGLPEISEVSDDERSIQYNKMYNTMCKSEYYTFDSSISEASISAKTVCSSSTTGPSVTGTSSILTVNDHISNINHNGNITGLRDCFMMDDIVDQAKEAAVKASENKLFDILKRAMDAIFVNGEYYLEHDNRDGVYLIRRKEKITNTMKKFDVATTSNSTKNDTNSVEKKKEERTILPGLGSSHTYLVKKILYNPPALIVFWGDDTTTLVKCAENETFNVYHGFCAALAKKVYGCNNRVNKIVGKAIREKSKDEKKELKKKAAQAKKKAEEATKTPSTNKPTSKKKPSTKRPAPKKTRKEVTKK